MFSLIVTFYLTKTENRTKKSLTALTLLLWAKVLFWPKKANFLQKNADISKIKRILVLKGIFYETKYECLLTCPPRLGLKNKDLKCNVRKINIKWILLNQLKWILDKVFRTLCHQYQPKQHNLGVGFSLPAQASFFLICMGDRAGGGHPCPSCQGLKHLPHTVFLLWYHH